MGRGSPLGLYVHVPFCVHKCPYCDFVSGPVGSGTRGSHLDALETEIRDSPCRGGSARTVFFGGGTPSESSVAELERLVGAMRDSFFILPGAEWTIECNPGTLPDSKLEALPRLGFDRVSLGVQSFHDRHLRTLGRIHDSAQALECYRRVRRAGIGNVNLDLMFAVPGQTLEEWREDLQRAIGLGAEHLSLYNLTVEEGTEFGRLKRAGQLEEADEGLAAAMFEAAMDLTAGAGYEQYEISNYAQPGRRCLHNSIYWRNEDYLGFGVGAASFVHGVRWTNTDRFDRYAEGVAAGRPVRRVERLSPRRALGEGMMLAIRTEDGADLAELSRRHGVPLPDSWSDQLRYLSAEGFVTHLGQQVRLTRRGRLVADSIAAAFL